LYDATVEMSMSRLLGAAAGIVIALLFAIPASADWTTYHFDNAHTGNDTSAAAIAGSGIAWTSTNLAGDVTAEPLYFNGVVYVATMQDYLYALNPSNGTILWADHLDNAYDIGANPLPCGNDYSFIGIMGTPVIDPATSTLYAVGMVSNGTYHFWAINLNTHALVYSPIVMTDNNLFDPAIHNQRGSLTLYNGQVFVPFGGRDGDCGSYHGWVFRLDAATGTGMISYHTLALGAGMWGRAGGVIVNGFYTIATGNAVQGDQCESSTYKEQNAVVKLYTDLTLYQYWAPTDWASLSCSDTDIGSTGPSLLGNTGYIFQSGKNGQGYLLNAANLGGIGGEVGTSGGVSVCGGESLGGNGYDPATGDLFVPCGSGLYGFSLSGTTLTPTWNHGITAGAPIIIGGAVWAIDRGGAGLFVYRESDGTPLFSDGTLGGVSHGFASPSYGGGLVFAAGNSSGPIVRAYFAGGWSASYNLSSAPTTWTPNQSQTFNVTLTNTGTQPWPHSGTNPVELDLHFTTQAGGSAAMNSWLTSQIYTLPADVGTGASTTFSVTATAPNQSGSMLLEATMFKNQQFWFKQWNSVAVTISAATWSASYNVASVPGSWVAGQSQTFNVTVTNTGNVTWPHTGYTEVDLDLHFTTVLGGSGQQSHWLTSLAFALPNDVAPAGSATVSVTLTAPTTTGPMWLEAEMIKEHQFWFSQVASAAVNVAAPNWSASYNLTGAPANWVAGQSQTFNVTVTNTGNTVWPHTGYTEVDLDLHFTTVQGGSGQQSHWLTSLAFALAGDVAPAGSATVSVTLTAPTTIGSMYLEAEMIKEHQFWFSQVASVPTNVAAPAWSASYNLTGVPASWTASQSQTFSVTVTNTGNTVWPHAGYTEVDLDFHFTTVVGGSGQQSHWLTSLAFSLPNDVAPGSSVTLSVTVTAPSATGSMSLEAEMIREHQFWFTQVASVPVTVA
jgi:polyvinyl alcohol dehydrogenase (cytochrome)